MKKFIINLGGPSYPVFIGKNLLNKLPEIYFNIIENGEVYVIIDELVYNNYHSSFKKLENDLSAKIFLIKAGKSNKSFASAMTIFADMNLRNISRDTTIIAIGGGVVGDLSGFIASCWYRGVRLIHFPSTLLSAVDSCLGGKTAINFLNTINAIGTYHHPSAIIIDTSMLLKLPKREVASGFGEIIKYSVIGSNDLSSILEEDEALTEKLLGQIIYYSLKQKEKFVLNDIYEGEKRLFLNFGHTIGHAIEFSTIFNGVESLRHGEGVALGMVAIFRICIYLGMLKESDLDKLKNLLHKYNLPLTFNASDIGMSRESLSFKVVQLAFKDKKRTSKNLRLVVANGWGKPQIYSTNDSKLIEHGVKEVIK